MSPLAASWQKKMLGSSMYDTKHLVGVSRGGLTLGIEDVFNNRVPNFAFRCSDREMSFSRHSSTRTGLSPDTEEERNIARSALSSTSSANSFTICSSSSKTRSPS